MPVNKEHITYARNIGFVIAADIAVFLLGFLRFPLLTKYLGASYYGTWSIILVTISLASPLALLGLTSAIVRFLPQETDKYKIRNEFFSIFVTVSIMGIILSLLLFFSSDFIATFFYHDFAFLNRNLSSFVIFSVAY